MTKQAAEALTPAVANLFGYSLTPGSADLHLVDSPQSGFTFRRGVPPMYRSPSGKKVPRPDMNGIGRLVSQSGFMNAMGGFYTFDPAVASAIGGYPYGAILRWLDPDTGLVRIVRSLKPDNTADFVASPSYIDGENWAFVDTHVPSRCRPRVFADWSAKTTGTLSLASPMLPTDPFARSTLLTLQSGIDRDFPESDLDTAAFIWAVVRSAGDESFHSAALISYVPPKNSAYNHLSQIAQFVYPPLIGASKYTSNYASSPVQLWLKPGDSVALTSNIPLVYSVDYVAVPLIG